MTNAISVNSGVLPGKVLSARPSPPNTSIQRIDMEDQDMPPQPLLYIPTGLRPQPPIQVSNLVAESPSCSSPLDESLMDRKASRTKPRMPMSSSTINALNAVNEDPLDSSRSSPIGSALMERRAQRQSAMRGRATRMELEDVHR